MIGALPQTLTIGAEEYEIRSDYRDVLQVFEAFSDPELPEGEKGIVAIKLLLEPFKYAQDVLGAQENGFDVNEAFEKIVWFIYAGKQSGNNKELPVYDWLQDEQMIFSAVNKVAGRETRSEDYIHWWTFLGWFNGIGEGDFSFVVGIRNKLNHGKKLEKYEREYLSKHKDVVRIKKRMTEEEKKEEEAYQALLDEVL